MLNPADAAASAAALSFPSPFQVTGESPLTKLMEHCNKFGNVDTNKLKLEPVKADGMLLPTDMNAYSQYLTPQWFVDQSNWPSLYPSVTNASAVDTFQNYFPAGSLNLLSSSVSAVSAAQSVAQSALSTAMANQQRVMKSKQTSSASTTQSSGNAAGGKFQGSRAVKKCECPNCQEAEKFGTTPKREIHNCHHAGCGKIYKQSSHLKAHLRWHSEERHMRTRF